MSCYLFIFVLDTKDSGDIVLIFNLSKVYYVCIIRPTILPHVITLLYLHYHCDNINVISFYGTHFVTRYKTPLTDLTNNNRVPTLFCTLCSFTVLHRNYLLLCFLIHYKSCQLKYSSLDLVNYNVTVINCLLHSENIYKERKLRIILNNVTVVCKPKNVILSVKKLNQNFVILPHLNPTKNLSYKLNLRKSEYYIMDVFCILQPKNITVKLYLRLLRIVFLMFCIIRSKSIFLVIYCTFLFKDLIKKSNLNKTYKTLSLQTTTLPYHTLKQTSNYGCHYVVLLKFING